MGFFDGNLLSECVLNKVNFEGAIGLGNSKKEILDMFALSLSPDTLGEGVTVAMLDKWCRENYNNMGFDQVFSLVQAATLKKYKNAMVELGVRGNPSAIAVMNEVILKKQAGALVQINYVNSLPPEDEESKADDEQ